jgi:hypothetical protein
VPLLEDLFELYILRKLEDTCVRALRVGERRH